MIKKGKNVSLITGTILCLMLLVLCQSDVIAKTMIDDFPEFTVGDYFIYDFDEKIYIDNFGKTVEEGNYIGHENLRFGEEYIEKISSKERINIDDETYDCIIIDSSWNATCTMLFKEGSTSYDEDKVNITLGFTNKEWIIKSERTTVKEERFYYYEISTKNFGKEYCFENEITKHMTYNKIGKRYSFPLSVGKSWYHTINVTTLINEKSRINNGAWEHSNSKEEERMGGKFEVISEETLEVPAGKFNCYKIHLNEPNDSQYIEYYISEQGFIVKKKYYDYGELEYRMELKEYNMFNNEVYIYEDEGISSAGAILLFSGILAVSLIIVGTLFFHQKKSSQNKILSYNYYSKFEPQNQPYQYQQFYPIQQPPPPPPPQNQFIIKICPICGQPQRYVEQYHLWYCDFCQRYV